MIELTCFGKRVLHALSLYSWPSCSVLGCQQLCVSALLCCCCSFSTLLPTPFPSSCKCMAFDTSNVHLMNVDRIPTWLTHCCPFKSSFVLGSWYFPHAHSHLKNHPDFGQLGQFVKKTGKMNFQMLLCSKRKTGALHYIYCAMHNFTHRTPNSLRYTVYEIKPAFCHQSSVDLNLCFLSFQSSFKETYMYDFFKSFQEDKCIEKVKKVFYLIYSNMLVSVVLFISNCRCCYLRSVPSFSTRSLLTSPKNQVGWRTQWCWRRGERSSWTQWNPNEWLVNGRAS